MADVSLAWIGLGNMGMAMAANLANGIKPAGLKVFNRSHARSMLLAHDSDAIIEVTASLSELASGSDIIFVCLANDEAVMSTIDALLGSNLSGKLLCDMSTIHPETTRAIAHRLENVGCSFVAAPVFGAPPVAVAAKLVVAAAGNANHISRLEPFLKHMSRATLSLGDLPEKASLMKITGNSFILAMIETIAEGLTFSEVSGLGVDNTLKFISTVLGGPWQSYADRMVSGAYMPEAGARPGFAIEVAFKDCTHALNLAKESERPYKLSILEHVQQNLDLGRNHPRLEGRGDVSSVYGVERERAGLDFANEAAATNSC